MKIVKNDLFDYGLEIFQDEEMFKFSLDSILLAEFVQLKSDTQSIVDFCTGNAAIPLILSTKTKCPIMGFEIQKRAYELAYNSVSLNHLSDQIKVVHANLNEALEYLLPESVDIISCNPPFFKVNEGSYLNEVEEKAIARHEMTTNLDTIARTAKYLLKNKGVLYMVHRPERLMELAEVLKDYKFSVKRIQFIYSSFEKNAIMVLIKAVKNGANGVIIPKPICIADYKTYQGMFH